MRHALFAGILLVSSTSAADPKAVQATVKTSIVQLAKLAGNDALQLAPDAIVVGTNGERIDLAATDGCVSGAVANAFYGCELSSIAHEPGAITVGVAGTVAWFQAPFSAISTPDSPDDDSGPTTVPMRFGGIAIASGSKWKIAAAMYAIPISDKRLLAEATETPASKKPALHGDTKLAEVVAGWFATGFAPNAAKTGTLIASGTAPAELKTGTNAATLAASWDKLKLGAIRIEATRLAGGKVGWITADVRMPRKSGKSAVAMKLAAVVVPDGEGWRWVSLQYQFAQN